jgi:uncharacterized membrane protein
MATEKPMEFAFLNAFLRSDTFPPHDPWLSGFAISYYYFGYLMMAMLARLSGVPSAVAFNLAITLLFSLTVTGAYALVYNLIGAGGQGSKGAGEQGGLVASLPRCLVPLLGPLLVAILGNLEAIFEVLYSKGLGSAGFWNWLDIKELLTRGQVTGRWFDLGTGWWWWRASRVIHDKDLLGHSLEVIDEFPFFSFMLGDMHPHVLALPFVLLALALALNVLKQEARGKRQEARSRTQEARSKTQEVRGKTQEARGKTQEARSKTQGARGKTQEARGKTQEARGKTQGARGKFPVPCILHLASCILHPASCILHPASCLLPPASCILHPASCILHPILYALCLGALAFLNTWDFPIYLFVVAMAYGMQRYGEYGRINWALVREVVYTAVGLGILGGLLYLPFYIGFQSQAGGILPNLFNPTRLHQYLIFFGPFLFVVVGFAVLVTKQLRAEGEGKTLLSSGLNILFWAMILPPLAASGSIAIILFTARGQAFLRDILANEMVRQQIGEADLSSLARRFLAIRLGNPWTWLFLAVLIAWVVALLWGKLQSKIQKPKSKIQNTEQAEGQTSEVSETSEVSSTLFVLLMVATALLLTLSVEFIYIKDTFNSRMNTVFKFYYQAWVLLALASAYGLYYIIERAKGLGRALFLAGFAVLFILGMIYPLAAGFDKAGGFAHQPTLDGLAWVRQRSPDEYAAVEWLNKNVSGTPVILEATGGSFTEYGRVSSRTGLPTLLGWGAHEWQWRGNYEEPGRREPDINAIYSSLDTQQVLTLLEKYDITYVYVGHLERGKYSPAALAKFGRFMDVVFQQGNVIIYKRRPSARE